MFWLQAGQPYLVILIQYHLYFQDPRFNQNVDSKTGYRTRSILCCPIIDQDGSVLGVAQAINKVCPEEEPFDEQDEKVGHSLINKGQLKLVVDIGLKSTGNI